MSSEEFDRERARFDRSGERLGDYILEYRIGSGGNGAVYFAQHADLPWERAIKLLTPPKGTTTDELYERWKRECATLGDITHPNIVRVYTAGFNGKQPYIVMEYVNGETLQTRIAEKRITTLEALERAADVAGALNAAHLKGIIHRDIKPGNILIDKSGVTKLCDFGLAQPLGNEDLGITKRYLGSDVVVGTLEYISPEQLAGQDAGTKSDIFSLGKVLYNSLLLRNPDDGTERDTIKQMAELYDFRPAKLASRFGEDIDSIVSKLLQKQPDLRPDASETYQELRTIISSKQNCEKTSRIRRPVRATLLELAQDIGNDHINERYFSEKYGLFMLIHSACYHLLKNPNDTATLPKVEQVLIVPKDKTRNSWTIGRKDDADLIIDTAQVSRKHATIYTLGDGNSNIFSIEDNDSVNGTAIDGIRIPKGTRAQIRHGTIIGIAEYPYVFADPLKLYGEIWNGNTRSHNLGSMNTPKKRRIREEGA